MVSVTFFKNQKNFFSGFSLSGHAGMGEYGKDIVCAAVSSAVYMVINTLTDIISIVPEELKVEDGNVLLMLRKGDFGVCRDLLLGFRLHILTLSKQFPRFISVKFE